MLRLIAAALAILALAEPLYDPTPVARGSGPLVLVVDNGWTSAAEWETRQAAMNRALTGATRDDRPIIIIGTAENTPVTTQFLDPATALQTINDMTPRPWLPDRAKVLEQLQGMMFSGTPEIMWLSDGLDHGDAKAFGDGLAALGTLGIFSDEQDKGPLAMRPPDNVAAGFGITLTRVPTDVARTGRVAALDARGQILETAPYTFQIRQAEAKTEIALPLELRNDTVRIALMGHEFGGLGPADRRPIPPPAGGARVRILERQFGVALSVGRLLPPARARAVCGAA